MANYKITDLTPMTAGQIDYAADYIEIADVSANQSKKIKPADFLAITGVVVGTTDSQTISNKSLGNSNILTIRDDRFTLQDDADTTKQAQFQLSGITTGTTRTYTLPNASSTLVDLSTSQTLTNKTLTSPVINTATIANPTLTVDSIAGYSSASTVAIAGLTITSGVLQTANSVQTSNIQTDAVTDTQLDYPRWWQEIARTTLSSAGDTITVSSIPARTYLRFMFKGIATGGTLDTSFKFNNDGAANYIVGAINNGTYGAGVASANIAFEAGTAASGQLNFGFVECVNLAANEKIGIGSSIANTTAGSGTAPSQYIFNFKWANSAAQINRIDWVNTGTGDFAIGSEVVVMGHD